MTNKNKYPRIGDRRRGRGGLCGVWCFLEVKDPRQLSRAQMASRELSLTAQENELRELAFRNDLPFKVIVSFDEALAYMERLTV